MPVPEATEAPRVLLRHSTFSKLLQAIQDGPLVPGERLHDPELTAWLGVSRTPIREALAQLQGIGLVEMEANRYTRVAVPTKRALMESIELLIAYGEVAARRVIPTLGQTDVDALERQLQALAAAPEEPRDAVIALAALVDFFVTRADRTMLAEQTFRTAQLAQFSTAAGLSSDALDIGTLIASLRAAADARDGIAASNAFRDAVQSFDERLTSGA